MVELRKLPLRVKLANWVDICSKVWAVTSSGCSLRFLCDSTRNVETTAEKRPAWPWRRFSYVLGHAWTCSTYKDKESIDVI